MMRIEESTKAQGWELEVICKNKKYLTEVVSAILKYGLMNFEVEVLDCNHTEPEWDGVYSVFIWCSWFHNLKDIACDLSDIEKNLEFHDIAEHVNPNG